MSHAFCDPKIMLSICNSVKMIFPHNDNISSNS